MVLSTVQNNRDAYMDIGESCMLQILHMLFIFMPVCQVSSFRNSSLMVKSCYLEMQDADMSNKQCIITDF